MERLTVTVHLNLWQVKKLLQAAGMELADLVMTSMGSDDIIKCADRIKELGQAFEALCNPPKGI